MSKIYQYLDPSGTQEVIDTMLDLSDNAITQNITNDLSSDNNKIPSALVTKQSLDFINEGINVLKHLIQDSQISVSELQEFVSNTNVEIQDKLSDIEDKFDQKTIEVDFIQCYIINYKYNEVVNPENNAVYIYLENNRYGLAYYNNGWIVSGVIMEGIEDLIKKEEFHITTNEEIRILVNNAYIKINPI